MKKTITAIALAAASFSAMATSPAHAAIECRGSYQWIPGTGYHASPYCEVKNLYNVARGSYGVKTSFRKLRNSLSERQSVCRFIGHDTRVQDACSGFRRKFFRVR